MRNAKMYDKEGNLIAGLFMTKKSAEKAKAFTPKKGWVITPITDDWGFKWKYGKK